ncbi:MAG TPA: hypothetical protein VGB55_07990, partial [Tepidisphaeraceae bacterium]
GGWYETKNDPLESAAATSKWLGEPPDQLTLANAASAQMAVLRRSLLTGLAASAQRNIFRGATTIRLFEIDRTFNVDSGKTPGVWTLSGIAGGAIRRANWQGDAAISFYHVKGELEDLLEGLGVRNIEFTPAEQQPLAAGTGAHIKVGGTLIGYVGELDAKQIKIDRQAFKLFVFDINLAALEKFAFPTPAYQPMNKLPPVTRDLAIVVKSSEPYAAVASIIHETGGAALEKLELVDEYTGKPVPAGHRSLAMRLTFRDAHRTLATPEVTERVQAIVEALEKRLSATLRA